MLDDYPLNHVETAAVSALDDAAKAIVETLVSVIVARCRSIVSKIVTRDVKIALLTLSIVNINMLVFGVWGLLFVNDNFVGVLLGVPDF